MAHNQRFAKYDSYHDTIVFPQKISVGMLPYFVAAIRLWKLRSKTGILTLDFTAVEKAFSNGMLGIIAIVNKLRQQGHPIRVLLPRIQTASKYFSTTGWSHLLAPDYEDGFKQNHKHYVQKFQTFNEVPTAIYHFMEIIMGHIQMPPDVLAGLEWSITEICDNVINHSQSDVGGFLQVIAYPKNNLIAFTVADAGKGIYASLKEGIPSLKDDVEAIEQAIKAGITRNKAVGQGNGLAGTYNITKMTGGSLNIYTGSGRLLLDNGHLSVSHYMPDQQFTGTCISGQIKIDHSFSIINALPFGAKPYDPYTIVDAKFERPDEDALEIIMINKIEGAGTRVAGAEFRNTILNLTVAKPNYPIYLNWAGVAVIASSFADEFLGKLFVELGKEKFESTIKNIHLTEVVEHIIRKAISERVATG